MSLTSMSTMGVCKLLTCAPYIIGKVRTDECFCTIDVLLKWRRKLESQGKRRRGRRRQHCDDDRRSFICLREVSLVTSIFSSCLSGLLLSSIHTFSSSFCRLHDAL
ncbi:hypothetical protein ATANTOWER_024516 [Ataeniobius toweri]|uniref:Uncharacterized protein n=1 Tax=Ataeniobius toweri TaxID=208326 RepID=A0ABU7BTC7_9TELE|nr:hypothetical protein [Ataeniobius toweri]